MKEAYEPLPAMFGWKAGSRSKGGGSGFRVQGLGAIVHKGTRKGEKKKEKKVQRKIGAKIDLFFSGEGEGVQI